MSQFLNIINEYALFEIDVRQFTNHLFNQACSSCSKICCSVEMCYESLESPFLACLHEFFPPPLDYSKDRGWLTSSGCILTIGRPPVCHEFLCNNIIGKLPETINQYVANVLSYLISHIGKRALGSSHIVEIMHMEKLPRIDRLRFNCRLFEARLALKEIKSFYNSHQLNSKSIKIFSKICRPPPTYTKTVPSNNRERSCDNIFHFPMQDKFVLSRNLL